MSIQEKSKMSGTKDNALSVVVVGGCGHVGLPLGIKFALAGAKTSLLDIDEAAILGVNGGCFPFVERGGEAQLKQALALGLRATSDPCCLDEANVVVFVTGTPVDEHLNPKVNDVIRIFDTYAQHFKPETLVVMRSTLFPGMMEHLYNRTKEQQINVRLAFCPERVAQGVALDEIDSLPQIVSAFDDASFEAAKRLFSMVAPGVLRLTPLEAELTKLMANSWRYLEFAIANQFYMIAESHGVDFARIFEAIRFKYPRAAGYKAPGLAAGPCLFKDTMQLASFFDNKFYVGHAAMLVNEGLATFIVDKLVKVLGGSLWGKTVGVLGMTFKANNDDIRESLSFKSKKVLEFRGAKVLWHDPYLDGSSSLEEVLEKSDGLIVCTPHREYLELSISKPVVDVWGIYHKPELEYYPSSAAEEPLMLKRANG